MTAATLHVAMTVPETDVPALIGFSESRTDRIAIGSAGFGQSVAFGAGDALLPEILPAPGPAKAMPLAHATTRQTPVVQARIDTLDRRSFNDSSIVVRSASMRIAQALYTRDRLPCLAGPNLRRRFLP